MSNIMKNCDSLEGKDKVLCNIENDMINIKNNSCIDKDNINIDMNSKIDQIDSKFDAKKSEIRKTFTKCMNLERQKCMAICDTKNNLPFINAKTKCEDKCNSSSELSFFSF